MENQFSQRLILGLLDYQLLGGIYLRSLLSPLRKGKNGRLMRRLILMKMRSGRIYLDRLLHVGLLELVRLVNLTSV